MKIVFPVLILCFALQYAAAQDIKAISIPNNDILYIPAEDKIYVTTPGGGSTGNSLCVIDPYFGTVETCYAIGSNPGVMALSDDGQMLYIGMGGTAQVVQFSMATKTIVAAFSLGNDPFFGPRYAEDIAVLPGQSQSIAVSMQRLQVSPRHSGVAIIDNGIIRPNITQDHTGSNSITFANGTLYGYNNETTEFGLRNILIAPNGATEGNVLPNIITGFDNKIESQGNRIYAKGGEVVSVAGASPVLAGTLQISNTLRAAVEPAPDSNVVYVVTHDFFSTTFRLETFSKTTFNAISSINIPNMNGDIKDLIHWGTGGKLAFNTPSSVVLLRNCTSAITTPPLITTPSASACVGDTVTLNGPAGYNNYFWSDGSTTPSIQLTISGIYSLYLLDSTGCQSPASNPIVVTFEQPPPPPFVLEPTNVVLCQGETATFTAFHSGSGDSFLWSNGATTSTIQVSTAGTYVVASVTASGCVGEASSPVTLTFRNEAIPPQPIIESVGATTFCAGGSVILSAPAGFAQYLWSNGLTTFSIEVTETSNYTVQVVNAAGCVSIPSAPVPVLVIPTPDQPFISQNGNLLASSASNGNQWFLNGVAISGATGQFYTPLTNGFYSVQSTLNGCPSPMSALLNFMLVDTETPLPMATQLAIYPNPTRQVAHIQYANEQQTSQVAMLRICHTTGKYSTTSSDTTQIDLTTLPTGIYTIQWIGHHGQLLAIKRLVKQ